MSGAKAKNELKVPSSKPSASMAIEMMFEDIPNSTYSSVSSFKDLKMLDTQKEEKSKASSHRAERLESVSGTKVSRPVSQGHHKLVKSGSEPQSRGGSSAAAARLTRKVAVDNSKQHDPPVGSRSAEETGVRRSNRRSGSNTQVDRMTPVTALAMFGPKLTVHERNEIKEFSSIYFMGLAAKKVSSGQAKVDQSAFDDEENFYRVVPKDHICYRYEVAEKPSLGKGTFGQVIKAYDHKERTHVALKLVRNERIYLKQSREELRILQVLRKQDPNGFYNIVLMKEFFMFRNHMIIAFELLGMNLYQVLSKNGNRGLPMPRVLPIARGILRCLELLFKNRIIHCDLKPENIMLRRNGDVSSIKVGDFGSSCYEQQQVYHYIQSRYYRAPEVIMGLRYGPAIDMWSLGCVLSEMSTGVPLFQGNNETDQLALIEEMLGEVPKNVQAKSTKFKEGAASGGRAGRRGPPGSRQLATEIAGDDTFKDFIAKMLTLDPNLRPTPLEIQDHPWLCRNRSTSRLKQHGTKTV